MTDPRAQATYQVRLGWGRVALAELAASEIVVIVDVLDTDPTDTDPTGATRGAGAEGHETARGLAADAAALPQRPTVFLGSLRNATATAQAVVDEQLARGGRTAINLVLVGDRGRFAVEDYLAAGAIGDALSARGLDHTAPDLAVATEGFRPLTRAVKHLISASAAGIELSLAGRRDEVKAASEYDVEAAAARCAP